MKKIIIIFIVASTSLFSQISQLLDANSIRALFNPNGSNFWDQTSGSAVFEVPQFSGKNSAYVSSLWVGGLDNSNNLHMAGQTYLQKGTDYFPGPVSNATGYANSASWNKVWKVSKQEINSFNSWFSNPSSYPTYTIPPSISFWPGNGNVTYGQAAQLAPYIDYNNDGIYNPTSGDYPCIKGDLAVFYIINDDKATHTETAGQKLKVEIHCMAYSFFTIDESLDHTIFIDYKIFNRSLNNYHNVYLGTFDDFDIGDFSDDYLGSNISKNLYYTYNGDNNDAVYGTQTPALGVTYLKTPEAPLSDGIDNDHNGTTDESNEMLSLCGVYYYNSGPGFPVGTIDPTTPKQYYNYTRGLWRDSTYFKCGGTGHGGSINTNYCYPGSSYSLSTCTSNWSEVSAPGDRRMIGSCGPFNFKADTMVELNIAYIWAQSTTSSNIASVNKLFVATDSIRNFYNYYLKNQNCQPSTVTNLSSYSNDSNIKIFPNPSNGLITIESNQTLIKIEVYNELGEVMIINTKSFKEIDISSLESGIYFLKIYTTKGTCFKRVVKI